VIDTRPLAAGLLSLVCSEPCFAQWQNMAPLPAGSSWLPSALQPYNPASGLKDLLPSLKGQRSTGKAQPQQRTYPFRPGNYPTTANTRKRTLKVGPCALPFMENCVVGPYVSAAFCLSKQHDVLHKCWRHQQSQRLIDIEQQFHDRIQQHSRSRLLDRIRPGRDPYRVELCLYNRKHQQHESIWFRYRYLRCQRSQKWNSYVKCFGNNNASFIHATEPAFQHSY